MGMLTALLALAPLFAAPARAGEKGAAVEKAAESVQEYAVTVRRAIHQKPELRWKEDETLGYIEAEVRALLKDNRKAPATKIDKHYTGGLVVDVQGKAPGRKLFRADVDALPLVEATGLPFASRTPGVMHACGHDAHAAMLLAALKAVLTGRVEPRQSLRFVFQRAEENPSDESGGARLVREGILEGVDEVYGLHVDQTSAPGLLLSRSGPFLANSDRFRVKLMCAGGHVANPEKGSNAIDILTDLHVALRGFDRRVLGALEPCSLTPAVSKAGTMPNIRPAEAEIWYGVRHYLDRERRDSFSAAIRKRIESVVAGYPDAKMEYEYVVGHPALINTPEVYEKTSRLLQGAGFKLAVHPQDFSGDDLAHYLNQRPGNYWALGVHKEGAGSVHSPNFDLDESAMKDGIRYWLTLAAN